MAHFAKLGINGKVIGVHSVSNSDILDANGQEDERLGQQFLQRIHGWPACMWIQTSYNTMEGKHYTDGVESADQSKAFRGNYAGVNRIWDEDNQLFYVKKPYESWVLNTTTATWHSPIGDAPDITQEERAVGTHYAWNESTKAWDEVVS